MKKQNSINNLKMFPILSSQALLQAKAAPTGDSIPSSPTSESEMISQAKARDEYAGGENDWDGYEAPEFGGQSEILFIKVGEVAKDLLYTGHATSNIGGKEMEVHTANTASGTPLRLPIAASFLRALDQARVQVGDVIALKRFDDVVKKAGVGKGTGMQIFGLKVVKRGADPTAA